MVYVELSSIRNCAYIRVPGVFLAKMLMSINGPIRQTPGTISTSFLYAFI